MPQKLRNWLRAWSRWPLFRTGLLTAAVGFVLISLPPLQLLSYDVSYLVRPRVNITNLVLILFDDQTLNELGSDHNELSRTNHARVLERLAQDKAKLICYDVVFAETNQNAGVDHRLAQAIKAQGSVFLAAACRAAQLNGNPVETLTMPAEPLRQAAADWGHTELFETPFGGESRRQLSWDCGNAHYVVWLAALSQGLHESKPNSDRWLDYYGTPVDNLIPRVRFQDVLATNGPGTLLAGFFKDKIVFVGEGYNSLGKIGSKRETFATPYSLFGYHSMAGVEIHATAMLNLIRGDWLRRLPLVLQWCLAVLWGFGISGALEFLAGKSRIMMISAAIIGAVVLSAGSLFCQWHYFSWWGWIGPAIGQTATALLLVWRAPERKPYVAFISYRTEEDGAAALLIARSLAERGLKAFIDVRSLESGKFDEQLLREIENSSFFVIILSGRCLARCVDPNDWLLKEISHALSLKKVIIPVLRGGFAFAPNSEIPDIPQLVELSRYHGVHYSNINFDGFLDQLIGRLRENPGR